ncbi:hypothetical protein ALP29_200528 [Pseudomonas syringae pv. avii]|uniref:Uncharacterized protein n=1 Tax=Pseudomonas syringae pv. avii TaxID=663959 RepID=A0A3M5UPU1_PSESX|nr:hypothetical protein ALP29_200528 [Pseudomonas syringae pv. avii]
MTVKLLVAAHCQLMQGIDQITAVAPLLGQREVVADASVVPGKRFAGGGVRLATLQRIKRMPEALPLIPMTGFKQALLHRGPNRLRAMPFTCATALPAGMRSGSARMAASS